MSTIVLCHLTRCSNFPSLRHMKVLFFFSKIFSWIPIKGRKKVETNCEVWKKDQKEPIFPTEMIVWQIDIIFLYLMTFRANYRVTKQVLDWFYKLKKSLRTKRANFTNYEIFVQKRLRKNMYFSSKYFRMNNFLPTAIKKCQLLHNFSSIY